MTPVNGKRIPFEKAVPVNQGHTIDLKQLAKDAANNALQVLAELQQEEFPAEFEEAAFQVTMELLLTPVKASINASQIFMAQQAAAQEALRRQGIVGG